MKVTTGDELIRVMTIHTKIEFSGMIGSTYTVFVKHYMGGKHLKNVSKGNKGRATFIKLLICHLRGASMLQSMIRQACDATNSCKDWSFTQLAHVYSNPRTNSLHRMFVLSLIIAYKPPSNDIQYLARQRTLFHPAVLFNFLMDQN